MIDNVLFFLKFKNDVRYFYDTYTIREALAMMQEHGYTAVPVINFRGVYAGSVSEGDFLWYLLDHKEDPMVLDTQISEIIRDNFMPAVPVSVSFNDLMEAALHQNYVPVVDDRRIFIGIVTRQTLIQYMMDEQEPGVCLLSPAQKESVQHSLQC